MAYFQYTPQWQGPLSGRSFEAQTEDAINGLHERCDEIAAASTAVATQTSNGLMSKTDKQALDSLVPMLNSYIDGLFV